ncbi:hypothetical protein IJH02_02060 [Candidatus Saccharibacteria bacterium]|nr:hypothetical protein [Candidatus Saccharibacteria bacterium]
MATVKKPATKKATATKSEVKKPAAIKPAKKAEKKSMKGLCIGLIIAAAAVVIAAAVCLFIFTRPNLVGTYKLTGIERDGEDQSNSISILEGLGMSATMELKSDKSGKLDLFGEESDVTYDDKNITINGASSEYTFKDGKLSMEQNGSKLIFTKN